MGSWVASPLHRFAVRAVGLGYDPDSEDWEQVRLDERGPASLATLPLAGLKVRERECRGDQAARGPSGGSVRHDRYGICAWL